MALATSDKDYMENEANWGENAFVTLENIIDNIILTADDDSYFKHIKRFRASIFGKLAIKKLNVDIKPTNRAISFILSPSKIFPFPRYMTNWNRVSVINKCEKLQPLEINNSTAITQYLQDCENELFYDCDGEIITGENYNAEEGDCCVQLECKDRTHTSCDCECKDNSFINSWVKENREGSYFEFSEDLVGQEIVIEFQSSGLNSIKDCDIKIHHDMELTVMNYIQYNLLRGKRNVPEKEWIQYYNFYKLEKKRTERLLGFKITIERIIKSVSLRYLN